MLVKFKAAALTVVALGVLTFTAVPVVASAATGTTAKTASPSMTSHPARTAQTAQIPQATMTGTATSAAGQVLNFAGTFTPTSFSATKHSLSALGTLSGAFTDPSTGAVVQTLAPTSITAPVRAGDPSCSILNLNLGPLDLNLLGLLVHLNQVVLTITAQSGAGNLLGNLLCTVANLLNNSGTGNMIPVSSLLNHILSLL